MPIVSDILGTVDHAVGTIARTGFAESAGSVGTLISTGSAVLIAVLGINVVAQIRPMSFGTFFAFGLKIALVGLFARSWSNFEPIYTILTAVPESIGASMLQNNGAGSQDGLYEALDGMVSQVTHYGDAIGDKAGWVFGAVLGVVIWVIAALFSAIAAGIIAYAKIMLTIMVVFAPIAITASLFKPTMSLFEAWSRSIIGYAFMPIAAAGAAGISIAVAGTIADASPDPDNVETLSVIFPFIVVLLLSAGIMAAVPAIAQGLSGAFGLASNALGMSGMAQRGVVKTGGVGLNLAGRTGQTGVGIARARMNASAIGGDGRSPNLPRITPASMTKQTADLRALKTKT